jgi:glycogen debranching enzyme
MNDLYSFRAIVIFGRDSMITAIGVIGVIGFIARFIIGELILNLI